MKIAVYTIALNESQFVNRWYESAKEADYLLIADTGSTDGTQEIASKLDINVYDISVKPWRFDVARNASLALIPEDIDYCIALDMDELLVPGWRSELEKAFKQGITRPRYTFTWNFTEEGNPGLQFSGEKIHTRHNYIWKHPVHEVVAPVHGFNEIQGSFNLEIHHKADNSKPRSQYLPLLKLSVIENPYNDRNAFYYARELYFYGQYKEAIEEFKRHLELPTALWKPERAASMRYIAKMYTDFKTKEKWLLDAYKEDPTRREASVDLAELYYSVQLWEECLSSVNNALSIVEKPLDYLCEDFAWGFAIEDYAALSYYNLGNRDKAIEHGEKAIALNPTEERLKRNLEFYLSKEI
jgi:glycosyltransferase involved in cell wall biosynthesis